MSNRKGTWINADGLKVGFGARSTANDTTAHIETQGLGKELIRKISPNTVRAAAGYIPTNDDIPVLGGVVITKVALTVFTDINADVTVNLVDKTGAIVIADILKETAPARGIYGGPLETTILTSTALYVEVVSTATEGYGELSIEYDVTTSRKE